MSTMVDRVGRAILDEAKNFGPLAHHIGDEFERRLARAAIEAMKIRICPHCGKEVMNEPCDE